MNNIEQKLEQKIENLSKIVADSNSYTLQATYIICHILSDQDIPQNILKNKIKQWDDLYFEKLVSAVEEFENNIESKDVTDYTEMILRTNNLGQTLKNLDLEVTPQDMLIIITLRSQIKSINNLKSLLEFFGLRKKDYFNFKEKLGGFF